MLPLLADPSAAFQNGKLDIAIGMGSTPPFTMQNFSLSQALEAWREMDMEDGRKLLRDNEWEPGFEHYLGPLHLRFALQRLQVTKNECEMGEGNNHRRSWATILARRAVQARLLPKGKIKETLETWDSFLLYGQENLSDDEREIILGTACFVSTYAYLCRLATHASETAFQ